MKNSKAMISTARKKSTDPKQESLRDNKDGFNQDASDLISELIEFKKSINGRGSSKINIKPYKIQDPPPSELYSILSRIESKYNDVKNEAKSILDEQNHYSKTRKKSKKAMSNNNLYINKNASWWGSRLMTRFQFGDDSRKHRLKMMNSCLDVIRLVDDIGDRLDPNSYDYVLGAIDSFINLANIYHNEILAYTNHLYSARSRADADRSGDSDFEEDSEASEEAEEAEAEGGRRNSGRRRPGSAGERDRSTGTSGRAPETGGAGTSGGTSGGRETEAERIAREEQERISRKTKKMHDELRFIFQDVQNSMQLVKPILSAEQLGYLTDIEKEITKNYNLIAQGISSSTLSFEDFNSYYITINDLYIQALNIGKQSIGGIDVNSFAAILSEFNRRRTGTPPNPPVTSSNNFYSKPINKLSQIVFDVSISDYIFKKAERYDSISSVKKDIKKSLNSILDQLERRDLNVEVLWDRVTETTKYLAEMANLLFDLLKNTKTVVAHDYDTLKYENDMLSSQNRGRSSTKDKKFEEKYRKNTEQLHHLLEVNTLMNNQERALRNLYKKMTKSVR